MTLMPLAQVDPADPPVGFSCPGVSSLPLPDKCRIRPDTSLAKRVGAEFRRLRQEMGLSQYDVAARVGCGQPSVSRIERGLEDMTMDTLESRIAVLGGHIEFRFVLRPLVRG